MDFLNKEFIEDRAVDPVLRCDSCNKLVLLERLTKFGCCEHCGNKRVKALQIFNSEEADQMREWGLDDFLKEWEPVE